MAEETTSKERRRLIKLWEAYEKQEKEYSEALKKILGLEKILREEKKMKSSLRQLIEDKNREIMDLELRNTTLNTDLNEMRPQVEESGRLLAESKKRYAKLYALTEEVEEELERTRREVAARDRWFKENISNLERLKRSLDERKLLIEQAEKGEEVSSAKIMLNLEKPGIEEEIASVVAEEEMSEMDEEIEEIEEDIRVEEEVRSVPERAVLVEENTVKSRIDVIKEFSKIESLNPTLANGLFNAGFTTFKQLQGATTSELMAVKGFDEVRIESLRIDLIDVALE